MTRIGIACLVLCFGSLLPKVSAEIVIDTVLVGDTGNAPDFAWPGASNPNGLRFGSVDYAYRIGTTEVTNSQYVAFLNAKAFSDPYGLYHPAMGFHDHGGILRSGDNGSYTYAPKMGMEHMPVSYVNWYDTLRFSNWLHNGQGTGDTENGAYTLVGNSEIPLNGDSIVRNAGAKWFLPSENEWYKAAYYDPTLNNGLGGYWLAPTQSNFVLGSIPPGVENSANIGAVVGFITNVGSYPNATSYYGTFDQAGNVDEWNESLIQFSGNSFRGVRGGNYSAGTQLAGSTIRDFNVPDLNFTTGFRVANIPEPGSIALVALCGCFFLMRGQHRNS